MGVRGEIEWGDGEREWRREGEKESGSERAKTEWERERRGAESVGMREER